MKEVFVVMQGQYSDRHIEAIFDTEEMALAFTRAHRISAWESPYDIQKWQVNAGIFAEDLQWVEVDYDYYENTIDSIKHDPYITQDCDCGMFECLISPKSEALTRYIETGDDSLLLKTVQDRYAEYKARKENIT